jgi:polysaccharide export outer membrane protein
VRLVNRASKVYYVLGEVNTPGSYPLAGRETVLDAVVAAGWLTDRAAPDRVILSRPTTPGAEPCVLPVCLRHIVQLGDTTTNYQLQPGDRVFVPSLCLGEGGLLATHYAKKSPCNGLGCASVPAPTTRPTGEVLPAPHAP